MLLRAAGASENSAGSAAGFDLSYVLNYIEANLSLPLDTDDLSRLSRYSSDRFRHIFKDSIGMPPREYILNRRLEKAKRLLSEPEKTVTEIALDCGFYDSAHFCRKFKSVYGKSPSDFRKKFLQ